MLQNIKRVKETQSSEKEERQEPLKKQISDLEIHENGFIITAVVFNNNYKTNCNIFIHVSLH